MSGEKLPTRAPVDLTQSRTDDPLGHVSRTYLFFLQRLFAAFPSGHYHWTEDDETTEIILSDQDALDVSLLSRVPGVITIRGPFAFAGLSINQLCTMAPKTGARTHTDLLSGSISLNVVSDKGTVATRLAGLIASSLCVFRDEIIRLGQFHYIDSTPMMSAEQKAGGLVLGDSDHDFVVVSVQSSVHLQRTWSTELVSPDILEAVNADLRAEWARAYPVQPKLYHPVLIPGATIRLDD